MINYEFENNCQTAQRIYALSNHGASLFPWDLKQVALSVNPDLLPALENRVALDSLLESLADGTYHEQELAHEPFLRFDQKGFIYYKGYLVDHVHPSNFKSYHESEEWESLIKTCNRLEFLGLTPSIQNVRNKPLWSHISRPYDPFIFFVEHLSRIYQSRTDLLICHTTIPLNSDVLYRFRMVKMEALTFKEDSRQLPYSFDFFARDHSFQEVYFDAQTTDALQKWESWMETFDFKLWYLNPNAFEDFMLNAVAYGHRIEIPEDTYNHYMDSSTIHKMNYVNDSINWFLINPALESDSEFKTYLAFGKSLGKDQDQYFAQHISTNH